MDDDFDMTDDEVSDYENVRSGVGRRAIASIIEKADVDRVESKKKLKKLSYATANTPSTAIHRQYWYELFKQFARHTLKIDSRPDATPTGDDIARFLAQLPGHLQSRRDDGKMSWTVFQSAKTHLERALTFEHEGFNLSKRDALRLEAIIQQLLNDGEITKDPIREALWLSCQIVKRMVMAVLSDAITNGTKSWDTTVAGCLGLALQAALSSRAGDFTRSAHYTGTEYLQWKHIDLIAQGSSVEDPKLVMLVTLLYRKSHKNDPKNSLKVQLGQLDEENNAVDITKLLMVHALRIGAVKETTWEELVTAAIQRPSKRIIWSKPDWPVFFAHTKGERLDFANPAPVAHQTRFLRRAAKLIGMMARPVSHDLRRGAAADLYSLNSTFNAEGPRRSLGHSHASKDNGVTDAYIGRRRGDDWAARIANSANEPEDPFSVKLASTSFVQRKITTKDIDNYCKTNKLNVNDRNSRTKAREELAKIQFNQWQAHQQSILDNPSSLSKPNAEAPSGNESFNESHDPALIIPAQLESAPARLPLKDITNISLPPPATKGKDDASAPDTELMESTVTGMIDVLGFDNVDASDEPSVAAVDSMSSECVSVLAACQLHGQPSILTAPIHQFIGYFSTINLISVATSELPRDAETGNSRHEPTRFLHACRKKGCQRTFDTTLRRDQHEVNCKGASLDGLGDEAVLPDGENHQQPVRTGRKRKREDINVVHDGFPKQCPDSNICGVTKEFATKHLLDNHRNLHHDDNWPKDTACNVPGCQLPSDHYFVSREAFRRHLNSYHLADPDQAMEYIGKIVTVTYKAPRGTSASFIPTMCLYPDCKTTAEFANYSDYTMHLRRIHKQTPEQYPKYMPTAATVRVHPRPNIAMIDISSLVAREFEAGPCSYPLCSDTGTSYAAEPALVHHLKVSHGVEKPDASKYFNGPEIAPFYGTKCLHTECSEKDRFYPDVQKYKRHLRSFHGLHTVTEFSSFQLWHKLKYGTVGVANEQSST